MSFKIGDRVSVQLTGWQTWEKNKGIIDLTLRSIKATVNLVYPGGALMVVDTSRKDYPPQHYYVVPRQCRRLVKKHKKVNLNDVENALEVSKMIRKFNNRNKE